MEAGRFDDAATIYGELVTSRPNDAGLLMNLGMARYMAGHPDQALPVLRKAVRLNESLAPASLFLGAALLDLGQFAEASAPLARAVALMPQNPDAREMLARTYLAASGHERPCKQYRTLTTLQPLNPKGVVRTRAKLRGHRRSLVRRAPEGVARLTAPGVARRRRRRHAGKYPAALGIYRRAIETSPGRRAARISRRSLRVCRQERMGRNRAAEGDAQNAAYCATRVAECHFLDRKFREALTAAQQSTGAAARFWAVRAANRLAVEAVGHLETLPPSAELHLIRAEIAQSRNRNPEAVTEIRAALALEPGNPAIENALAEALVLAHNLDEALPLLERMTRERPGDGALLLMYGDALLRGSSLIARYLSSSWL